MTAPVWVVDTNVLVSAALTAGGNCDRILRAAVEGRIRLAWSPPMLAEYRAVLLRPRFKLPPPIVRSLLNAFGPSDQVSPKTSPALPDPDDEVFLAVALATPDKILVTAAVDGGLYRTSNSENRFTARSKVCVFTAPA